MQHSETERSLTRSVCAFLRAPVRWTGTRPYQRFLQGSLLILTTIFAVKVLLGAEVRLDVYVLEVAVIFVLGFVVLEGERARNLTSTATRGDVLVAVAGLAADVLTNLGVTAESGFRTSPQPGFADAIVLIIMLFVAAYGLRRVRPMAAPLSLLLVLAGITQFISNEDPTFYAYIGRYFVAATVWMSGGLLSAMGYPVTMGADSFRILGTTNLTVELGIRCGGLDVATIYTLLIGYFTWHTRLHVPSRVGVAAIAAGGAFLINGLRVAFLTVLFLNYPVDLVEAVHTNLGDFIFLGYALAFILILRRFPRTTSVVEGKRPPARPR